MGMPDVAPVRCPSRSMSRCITLPLHPLAAAPRHRAGRAPVRRQKHRGCTLLWMSSPHHPPSLPQCLQCLSCCLQVGLVQQRALLVHWASLRPWQAAATVAREPAPGACRCRSGLKAWRMQRQGAQGYSRLIMLLLVGCRTAHQAAWRRAVRERRRGHGEGAPCHRH